MLSDQDIFNKAETLKRLYAKRDGRQADVLALRRGEFDQIAPGLFPDGFAKPVVANFANVAAEDVSQVLAPLPSFNCSSSNMKSDTARTAADKRTKIVDYYLTHSDLEQQMFTGADHYISLGHTVIHVEPDFEAKMPRLTVESSIGSYPEIDRFGQTISHVRVWRKTIGELCAQFPEHAAIISKRDGLGAGSRSAEETAELVRYVDKDQTVLFFRGGVGVGANTVLLRSKNLLGRCPVYIAVRPSFDDQQRGQFDDVVWVQVIRARLAMLNYQLADDAVNAPWAIPDDVQDLPFGPQAVVRSNTPQNIQRVNVNVPQAAFAELANLAQEERLAARYPEGRTGQTDASVITGRGMQELLGTFNTQVQAAQKVLSRMYQRAVAHALELDEKLWPHLQKTIRGTQNDAPYEVKYTPAKDIKGNYTVDVVYGLAAGLDPNRAAVLLLQLLGAGAISKDFMLRQMPFSINVTDEFARIEIENLRSAAVQGIAGLAAAIPQLAASGQDPLDVVTKLAKVVQAREKGAQMEDAILQAFAPPKQPASAEEAGPGEPSAAEAPGGGVNPQDVTQSLVPGVAPGQAAMGPGGKPSLQMMLAGLTGSGQPQLASFVSRRMPTAG